MGGNNRHFLQNFESNFEKIKKKLFSQKSESQTIENVVVVYQNLEKSKKTFLKYNKSKRRLTVHKTPFMYMDKKDK